MKRSFNSKTQGSQPFPASLRETVVRIPTLHLAGIEREDAFVPGEDASPSLPLPGYDVPTRRVESGAFILLGLIGIILIVLAGERALEFSENREAIAAALATPEPNASANAQLAKKHALTNVTVIPPSAERMPVGSVKGPSHPS